MTTLREAAQQALEAMEAADVDPHSSDAIYKAIDALKAALAEHYCDTHCTWADHAQGCVRAEPVQEPVAWSFEARHIDTAFGPAVSIKHPGREHKYLRNVKPLYTAPPQPETSAELRRLHEVETLYLAAMRGRHAMSNDVLCMNEALTAVYEVWAGSEGIPEPQTACEAYLLRLIEQMRDIARAAIKAVEENT